MKILSSFFANWLNVLLLSMLNKYIILKNKSLFSSIRKMWLKSRASASNAGLASRNARPTPSISTTRTTTTIRRNWRKTTGAAPWWSGLCEAKLAFILIRCFSPSGENTLTIAGGNVVYNMNPIELKPTFALRCTGAYAKGDNNIPMGVEIGEGEIYCTGELTHTNAPSGFDIAEAGFCIVEKTENQEPVFPEWVENGENSAYHACEAHDGNLSLLAKNFEVSKQYSVVAYFRYRYAGSMGDYTVIRTRTYQTVTVRPSSPSYNIGGTVSNFRIDPYPDHIDCYFEETPAPNEYSELRQCGFCYSTTVDEPTYDAEGCEHVVAYFDDEENAYLANVHKIDTGDVDVVYIRPYAIFKDKNSPQTVTVYGEPRNCAFEEE